MRIENKIGKIIPRYRVMIGKSFLERIRSTPGKRSKYPIVAISNRRVSMRVEKEKKEGGGGFFIRKRIWYNKKGR